MGRVVRLKSTIFFQIGLIIRHHGIIKLDGDGGL